MTEIVLGTAKLIGHASETHLVWRGIQYAHHPIYTRRLTAAVDYTHPVGTWRCMSEPDGDRCAWLSIWKPATATGPLPVVAWAGDGGGPGPLSGCIFVRISYPAGGMGAFWAGEVSQSPAIDRSYIVSALRWIRRNIAQFGGDAENITLSGGKDAALAAEDAGGLYHKLFLQDAGGAEPRWRHGDAATQFMRMHRAVKMAAPKLAAEQDIGPAAPHWQVDEHRILRDPQGRRTIVKGVQFAPSTFVLHDMRTDYRFRERFGTVTLHDGSVIPAGPGTGVSEPAYLLKLGWVSEAWVTAQIDAVAQLGVNVIQVNIEPAMQFVPAFRDPINGQNYPSEMEALDVIVEAASAHGMAVQLRQANDRCPDEHVDAFMLFLIDRYRGRSNVWMNPANEINCFEGGGACADPVRWAADMAGHLRTIRGAGWTAPVLICGTSYSGNVAQVLAQMDADPIFRDDPNLIFGLHHYKADADLDFETSRRAVTEERWAPVLDGRYCAIVEESGPNNLGILDLDPNLNPPNPSSNPGEWTDTAKYFQQFLRWCGRQVQDGGLHGFVAFNWGSWSGSRNRDNSLTRIGTDGGLTGWGEIYRDEWLLKDYAPQFTTMAEALAALPEGEAVRRFLERRYLTEDMAPARAELLASGIRATHATGIEAVRAINLPALIAATPGSGHVAPADQMATGRTAPTFRVDSASGEMVQQFAATGSI